MKNVYKIVSISALCLFGIAFAQHVTKVKHGVKIIKVSHPKVKIVRPRSKMRIKP